MTSILIQKIFCTYSIKQTVVIILRIKTYRSTICSVKVLFYGKSQRNNTKTMKIFTLWE